MAALWPTISRRANSWVNILPARSTSLERRKGCTILAWRSFYTRARDDGKYDRDSCVNVDTELRRPFATVFAREEGEESGLESSWPAGPKMAGQERLVAGIPGD